MRTATKTSTTKSELVTLDPWAEVNAAVAARDELAAVYQGILENPLLAPSVRDFAAEALSEALRAAAAIIHREKSLCRP